MILICFQDKQFNITVIQAYLSTTDTKEAKVKWFYEDLQGLLELTPEKDILFFIGNWHAKVGSQEIPEVTDKFDLEEKQKTKANRVLPRELTGHSKHPLPTTQNTSLHIDINRWSILKSDRLYIFCS